MPAVSVIVPIYNTQDYIDDCLQSLTRQSFSDFEAICVNDGCTDASMDAVNAVASVDKRFVVVNRENGGLSAARNTGLQFARGEYVCFLDSDDRLAPSALDTLYKKASSEQLDILDYSAQTFYEDETAKRIHLEDYDYRKDIPGVFSGEELFTAYWQMNSFASSACFHFINRDFLEMKQLCFKEGLVHEDELFTALLYIGAKRAAYLNMPLYERRMRQGSIMTSGRGLANVESLQHITQELSVCLESSMSSFSQDYLEAFAKDIGVLRGTMMVDYRSLSSDEKSRFLNTLPDEEKARFFVDLHYGDDYHVRISAQQSFAERAVRKIGRALLGKLSTLARKKN